MHPARDQSFGTGGRPPCRDSITLKCSAHDYSVVSRTAFRSPSSRRCPQGRGRAQNSSRAGPAGSARGSEKVLKHAFLEDLARCQAGQRLSERLRSGSRIERRRHGVVPRRRDRCDEGRIVRSARLRSVGRTASAVHEPLRERARKRRQFFPLERISMGDDALRGCKVLPGSSVNHLAILLGTYVLNIDTSLRHMNRKSDASGCQFRRSAGQPASTPKA